MFSIPYLLIKAAQSNLLPSQYKSLKAVFLLLGFIKRFLLLFSLLKYDFIFIHREAAPMGPPIFEWIIAKVLRKKYIYGGLLTMLAVALEIAIKRRKSLAVGWRRAMMVESSRSISTSMALTCFSVSMTWLATSSTNKDKA